MYLINSIINQANSKYIAIAISVENSNTNLPSATYGSKIPLNGERSGFVELYKKATNGLSVFAPNSLNKNLKSNPRAANPKIKFTM